MDDNSTPMDDNGGICMTDDTYTDGEATIYYAMPTEPDDANAAALAVHIELLKGAHESCKALEDAGWKPRWCDDSHSDEFFEFAYEKRFASEDEAHAEVERLQVGAKAIWDEG